MSMLIQTIKRPEGDLVDARTLHAKLEVQTRFNDWIERRIEEYGFEEGTDFWTNLSGSNGGGNLDYSNLSNQERRHGGDRRSMDYQLTLRMAMELAMVERTEVGRKVRRYFIEMEQKARELLETRANRTLSVEQVKAKLKDTPSLRTMVSMRNQAIDLAKKLDNAEGENERRVIYSILCYVLDTIGQPAPELPTKAGQAKHLDV
ncbi:antA/AntB antirepressor family protein [Paludibacterium paludis]|uniref:AntA/AntB antirepressor domain-containing protein n=1 Tax=Paludibacterium paludis TaxID=1225769 RepID=A0A918NX90_9NEIS|nr:antA/AntB antirepressor family protein [Paludibacterium paludis]GGY03922.1 hypothetical protein GCM10011289_02850 [Paludibacterium paludis]